MGGRRKKLVMKDSSKAIHKNKKPEPESIQKKKRPYKKSIRKLNSGFLEAAEKGNLAGLQDFLGRGANINVQNKYGWTALMYAARYDYREMAKFLLVAGIDSSIRNKNDGTAQLIAIAFGRTEIAGMIERWEKAQRKM